MAAGTVRQKGTRFSGPVRNAETVLFAPLFVDAEGVRVMALPTDKGAVINYIMVNAVGVTGSPDLIVGHATDTDALVTTVQVTTALAVTAGGFAATILTPTGLLQGELGKNARLTVTVATATSEVVNNLQVHIYGYLTDYEGTTKLR
jgi:hypothetical protein